MEAPAGVDPAFPAWKASVLANVDDGAMEAHMGVEPISSRWEREILAGRRMRQVIACVGERCAWD